MAFVTEYLTDGARLVLGDSVTAADAAALHCALIELLPVEGEVVIDDTRVTLFDVTLLQLLIAFARKRRGAGRAAGTAGGPPSQRLAALGLGGEMAGAA